MFFFENLYLDPLVLKVKEAQGILFLNLNLDPLILKVKKVQGVLLKNLIPGLLV